MADVIFYSTGEIFWVSDPPPNRREHIGVPTVWPAVPSDEFFSYAMAAGCLKAAGHDVICAFGRQRQAVREAAKQPGFKGDPEFLALSSLARPSHTVVVLIATDSGDPSQGGADILPRIPFTSEEVAAFEDFRAQGGGVYVTWDHGQLGYESLRRLDLHGPIEPEPAEPLRPNTAHSNDSTDCAPIVSKGRKVRADGSMEPVDVSLSSGPPAGFLQKVIPAQLLYRDGQGRPAPKMPHPIFNGVGGADGTWIPAHMHEGKLKVSIRQLFLDESGIWPARTLAVHLPRNETSFNSFAVMAYLDPAEAVGEEQTDAARGRGRVLWDTSFHHLVDINWSSDGRVAWEPFAPFSADALWQQLFPPDLFDERLEKGMKRLLVNAVSWLAHDLMETPTRQAVQTAFGQLRAELKVLADGTALPDQPQRCSPGPRDYPLS